MSDYLKNLQESVLLNESFNRVQLPIMIEKDEFMAEIEGIFEDDDLNTISEFFKDTSGATHWKDIGRAVMDKGYTTGQQHGALAGLAAAAVAAAAIAGGIAIYKRFMSKAAKACAGKSGAEKTNCMNRFKVQAQKAKVTALTQAVAQCKKSKNPEKCENKLQAKIKAEKAKLGEM